MADLQDPKAVVYVLGAGISKAIDERMPVLSQLSATVRDSIPSLPAYLLDFGDDFERWLSYLAEPQPWLTESERLRHRALFLDIVEGLRGVLTRAQAATLSGPLPPWLWWLVRKWVVDQATVITLNYDWLVEATYHQVVHVPSRGEDAVLAGRPNYSNYRQLYVSPITPLGARQGAVLGTSAVDTFRLIKLHGSLNWFYSGAADSYGELVYDGGVSDWTGTGSIVREPGRAADAQAEGKATLIVPPTASKTTLLNNELLQRQWRLAYRALMAASRVVLLGYSLPPTDRLMGDLLLSAAARRTHLVVNPDNDVAQRLSTVMPDATIDTDFGPGVFEFADRWCEHDDTPIILRYDD